MSDYTSPKTIKKLNDAWMKREKSKRGKKKAYHPWQIFRNQAGEYIDKIVSEVLRDLEENKYK